MEPETRQPSSSQHTCSDRRYQLRYTTSAQRTNYLLCQGTFEPCAAAATALLQLLHLSSSPCSFQTKRKRRHLNRVAFFSSQRAQRRYKGQLIDTNHNTAPLYSSHESTATQCDSFHCAQSGITEPTLPKTHEPICARAPSLTIVAHTLLSSNPLEYRPTASKQEC